MSYAITALHLESPTFTVGKAGSIHSPMWYGTCGVCTDQTALRRLLGVVLGDMAAHMDLHRLLLHEREVELAEIKRETARKRAAA